MRPLRPLARRAVLLLAAITAGALSGGCRDGSPSNSEAAARSDGSPSKPPTKTVTENSSGCDCQHPPSFATAVEAVRPAVVNLFASEAAENPPEPSDSARGETRSLDPPGKETSGRSLGSGVILEPAGYLITNHHVVSDAGQIRARLLDGRWFETEIVGTDARTDLALLKLVGAEDVPSAPLADSSELEVGDWVIAIGNPVGLTSTVTVGVTSGIGRSNLQLSKELRYQDFIQTDASINPGNSGGPLVDARGRVVGVNTVVSAKARGIGFAIPSAMIEKELPWLKKGGDVARSWVGLYIDAVPEALREQVDIGVEGGALVTGVVDDGPADRAGLQKGDVIVRVGDTPVDGLEHLTWMAGRLEVGTPFEFVVQRGSSREQIEVVPASPPDRKESGSRGE